MEWSLAEGGARLGEAGSVFVCDDTPSVRHLIRINLELEGYAVREADDGAVLVGELDRLIQEGRTLPQVVIIDSQMHPNDGWWAIDQIRSTPGLVDLPVIMVTASLQQHDRVQARAAGLDAFVGKPFDPDHLVALVGGFCQHGRAFASRDRP
ncbi:MAG TPA: response regulator [Candidatus Lustribacter sp.]|nr:response regulator [Candidatus Lustribacter sp.]